MLDSINCVMTTVPMSSVKTLCFTANISVFFVSYWQEIVTIHCWNSYRQTSRTSLPPGFSRCSTGITYRIETLLEHHGNSTPQLLWILVLNYQPSQLPKHCVFNHVFSLATYVKKVPKAHRSSLFFFSASGHSRVFTSVKHSLVEFISSRFGL